MDEAEIEANTARWRVFLEENIDQLLEGMPKRPEGWWEREPDECPVQYMFRMFPAVRPH